MMPRNSQLGTSGPKVNKLETVGCWSCCSNDGFQFLDGCTHCEQILKEHGERLSDMQTVLDLHPGEASWQASDTENTI